MKNPRKLFIGKLESIYTKAKYSPIFDINPKYPNALYPHILYQDIIHDRKIIRSGNDLTNAQNLVRVETQIVAIYSTIGQLFDDGWSLSDDENQRRDSLPNDVFSQEWKLYAEGEGE